MSEHDEQVFVFDWAQAQSKTDPRLELLFAIPNAGKRSKFVGAKMKAEGLKAGVPDLMLAVPVGKYHGLFIEMKFEGGKTTELQKTWLNNLTKQSYLCYVCRSGEAAVEVISSYLNGLS